MRGEASRGARSHPSKHERMTAMKKAKITLHPSYRVGEISPRLFGAFLEPIGSMVNGSMYNPKHPSADELGLRTDFIKGLRESGLPCVRLPGGNFVSGWSWKDSIGPRDKRKTRLDLAWHQFIPNDVGHDEYLKWAERIGTEAMYTINLGTGNLNDATDIVEYTNFKGGTYWSDLRAENGHKQPYDVKVWYLGNEMDGPWQVASWEKDPRGYGVLAHETSKAMKFVDPRIETVACVSSSPFLNHYPDWDMQALAECYETVDYISMHHYHSAPSDNVGALLAGYKAYESYINTEIALCDYLKTKLRAPNTMMLSLDEYGSIARPAGKAKLGMAGRQNALTFYQFDPKQEYVRHDPDDWSGRRMPPMSGEMPRVLANMSTLLTLLRHADRVKIGCATGGLGDLCATDREHTWKSASYYPMTQLIRFARGVSLETPLTCEKYHVDGYAMDEMNQYGDFDDVETVQAAAALDEENNELALFVINADDKDAQELTLDARGFEGWKLKEHIVMHTDDENARNTYEAPNAILPTIAADTKCENGIVTAVLPKLSWNVFRFTK